MIAMGLIFGLLAFSSFPGLEQGCGLLCVDTQSHTKPACVLLEPFPPTSRLWECIFSSRQVSRDTIRAITYTRLARNTNLPQEPEQELIVCANILLEKEKPRCTQWSCTFTSSSPSPAELPPSTPLPSGIPADTVPVPCPRGGEDKAPSPHCRLPCCYSTAGLAMAITCQFS